jgi:hypothetical protein
MSQQVLIEALTQEIWDSIEKYGDSLPVASVAGILEVIKFGLIANAAEEEEE